MTTLLAVSLAGGLGALSRYLVDSLVRARWATTVPWATCVINVSASLLLGLLAGWGASGTVPAGALSVAGTGFCGGYSTFSTAAVELYRLLETGARRPAAGYAVALLVLPVLAATTGFQLTS